jgi:hypothetical protein
MRKTIITLALLFSTTTFAQEVFDLSKTIKCSDADSIMQHFREQYKEVPIWVGKTTNGTHVTLLVNKEKRSWTLIEYDSKLACILGAGDATSNPNITWN